VPADLDRYEVDRQEVCTGEQDVLAGHAPRCRGRVVVGDVTDGFGLALCDSGFDRNAPTLWLAEGLFFYLTERMIVHLLRDAASLSGPASVFAADVTGTVGLDSPAMRPYRTWCADNDVPPPFGTDDPMALFTAGGWRIEHITAPGAPDANYGRLRSQPAGFVPGRTHLVTAGRG
jgi:methyltransferase (TIGR00027 family)